MSLHEPPLHRRPAVPWSVMVFDCVFGAYTAFWLTCLVLSSMDRVNAVPLPEGLELPLVVLAPALTALNVGLWHMIRRRRDPAG